MSRYADIGAHRVRMMNKAMLDQQQTHRYGDPYWTEQRVGNRGNPSTIGAGEALTPAVQAELNTLASRGGAMAKTDARIANAAAQITDPQELLGFFIGVKISTGSAIPGPGQDRIRNFMKPEAGGTIAALTGFDIGQQLAWSITRASQQAAAQAHAATASTTTAAAKPGTPAAALATAKKTLTTPFVIGLIGAGILGYVLLHKKA